MRCTCCSSHIFSHRSKSDPLGTGRVLAMGGASCRWATVNPTDTDKKRRSLANLNTRVRAPALNLDSARRLSVAVISLRSFPVLSKDVSYVQVELGTV